MDREVGRNTIVKTGGDNLLETYETIPGEAPVVKERGISGQWLLREKIFSLYPCHETRMCKDGKGTRLPVQS